MHVAMGVILVEKQEIVMHIYQVDYASHFLLLSSQRYPLPSAHSEIIKVIAEFLTIGAEFRIDDWKICLRFLSPEIVKQIHAATGMAVETLGYVREQELILKGMASDIL